MNSEQQAAWLNSIVLVKLAPSAIHGVGVFAIRDIAKGTKLNLDLFPQLYTLPHSSFGKLFPEVKELILERWPQVVNGSKFAYPDTKLQAYLNHSDDANYDGKEDVALRDIKQGEEITENYRLIKGYEQVFPFLTKRKRGKIRA